MSCLLGQLHALIDGGASGNAVQVEHLKCPHAQRDSESQDRVWRWAGSGKLCSWWSSRICQRSTPRTSAVARLRSAAGERIDGFAAQQIVGVRMAAFNGHENLKCGLAGWRDRRASAAQPSRACSPASGVAAQKLRGGQPLLAFELNFDQFEPGLAGAGDEEAMILDMRSVPAARDPGAAMRRASATAMRCAISFLPSSVVNAPGQG